MAHQVLLDYRILISLYTRATAPVPSGRSGPVEATSIAAAERQASVDASAAGLEACAPLPAR